jgi:signal transduction protein with GAF and PtsI domain
MSDENGQDIGVNAYDEDELIEDEEAAVAPQPVGVVREEIVTITKDSDTENNDSEHDLYEVVKAHSDQISRLTYAVESLQSQIKQIDQRRRSTTKKKNKAIPKKPKGKRSNKRR